MATVYYSERVQVKISQGERPVGRIQRFWSSSPRGVWKALTFPAVTVTAHME